MSNNGAKIKELESYEHIIQNLILLKKDLKEDKSEFIAIDAIQTNLSAIYDCLLNPYKERARQIRRYKQTVKLRYKVIHGTSN